MSSVNFLYCSQNTPGVHDLMDQLRLCGVEVYDHECGRDSLPLKADLYVVTVTATKLGELRALQTWFPEAIFIRDQSIPKGTRGLSSVTLRWGAHKKKIHRVVFSRMIQIATKLSPAAAHVA